MHLIKSHLKSHLLKANQSTRDIEHNFVALFSPRENFPRGELEETTRTPSYYMSEGYPAKPEIQ